jgi:ketosteroid isomerase-like protein
MVLNRLHARGRESGAEVSADTAVVWTLADRRVVRLRLFWDRWRAFETVGLEDTFSGL